MGVIQNSDTGTQKILGQSSSETGNNENKNHQNVSVPLKLKIFPAPSGVSNETGDHWRKSCRVREHIKGTRTQTFEG